MKFLLYFFFIFVPSVAFSQLYNQQEITDSSSKEKITFNGFLEVYYLYALPHEASNELPIFISNYSRHNEFNVNMGYLKANYETTNIRANIALMTGSYANRNLAKEPEIFKNIFEANAGIRLSQKHDFWIDGGIFGSHIGFESAIGKDCQTLSRSITAENTPYYEAGLKLTYKTPKQKLTLVGLLLNGWQQIRKANSKNQLAFGTQVSYQVSAKIVLNHSTFIGTRPDSSYRNRFFNNFYATLNLNKRLSSVVGFDYGADQQSVVVGSHLYQSWYSMVGQVYYKFNPIYRASVRIETYQDQHQLIVNSNTPHGFRVNNLSVGIDFAPHKNALIRFETRAFQSKDAIFSDEKGRLNNRNYFFATVLGVSF